VNLTLELTVEQLAELARQVAPLVLDEITERGVPSPWLSLADGAAYLGVSERTLERAITCGRLRSSTLGRRRLLHPRRPRWVGEKRRRGREQRQPLPPRHRERSRLDAANRS
jgi:excisionase family DNA binding protein